MRPAFLSFPRAFWMLLALGVVLRVAAIELRPSAALLAAPDEADYLEIAQNVAAGNGFAIHGRPTAYRDMLFPFWAAAKGSVVGVRHGVLYAQLAADLLTALLLFLLVRRRLSERAALFALGAWVLYPAAILFTALFLTETLFVFLWVLALFLYDRWVERAGRIPAFWQSALLGVVLGLLLLTRSTGVILLAAILLTLTYQRRLRTTLVVVGVAFLTILPWMLRNAATLGAFALNTNSGVNLYIGNNPHATGAYRFDEVVTAPLDTLAGAGEVAWNRCAAELALDHARSHPIETLALWPRKFAYFWSTDMSVWVHYLPQPERSLREQLRAAPLIPLAVTGLFYMLLAAGGVAGTILVQATPLRVLLFTQFVLATLAALATYGLARYHYPLMPALVIGAASLVQKPGAWREATKAQRMAAGLAIIFFAAVWLAEIWTVFLR